MIEKTLTRDSWEGGIPDSLTLPCRKCGSIPSFDYIIDDDMWQQVVSKEDRRNVICLPCLDKMAMIQNIDISHSLQRVFFMGTHKTIKLIPTIIYRW